ncbi:hypothetical protein HQ447_14270 [bacterium]|nr:hypothetical protein [bacterium]
MSMVIRRKIVLDEKGDPAEVIIPYSQFVEMVETYGLDLTDSEESDLREALADSRARRREAFVRADEI